MNKEQQIRQTVLESLIRRAPEAVREYLILKDPKDYTPDDVKATLMSLVEANGFAKEVILHRK